MTEPYDTSAAVRVFLEATIARWRYLLDQTNTPVVAAIATVQVEIDGVGPVNVSVSYPADDPAAAIELAVATAKVMGDAL